MVAVPIVEALKVLVVGDFVAIAIGAGLISLSLFIAKRNRDAI